MRWSTGPVDKARFPFHVFPQGGGKQLVILKHGSIHPMVRVYVIFPDILGRRTIGALSGIVQTHQQLYKGGFSSSVVTDKGDFFPFANGPADVPKHGGPPGIISAAANKYFMKTTVKKTQAANPGKLHTKDRITRLGEIFQISLRK